MVESNFFNLQRTQIVTVVFVLHRLGLQQYIKNPNKQASHPKADVGVICR